MRCSHRDLYRTKKQDEVVRTFYEKGDIRSAEDHVRTFLFDKPEDFVNLDKLRKALHLHRRMTLREVIFKAYIADNEVRDIVEKREFNRLATNPKINLADFKALNSWRDVIPEYVKDYVQLNQFM